MVTKKPVLVTLTSPTAAGKSYLFNYLRDVEGFPCLISTTTRAPRVGEREGIDYYFIDEETSKKMEDEGQFAELAVYRGVRYGVTKKEFQEKLSGGFAFLIVEPSGIDHYVQPALDMGSLHLKYYIHTDPAVRLERFKARVLADVQAAGEQDANMQRMGMQQNFVKKALSSHMDRLVGMMTEEVKWGTMHNWDRTLFGDQHPSVNVEIILNDIGRLQVRDAELQEHEYARRLQNSMQYANRREYLINGILGRLAHD